MNATSPSSSAEPPPQPAPVGKDEDRREALGSAISLARLLLSVAAGTLVLSGTLLQTIYTGRSLLLLEIAWGLLGVSLLLGYLLHGRYITQLNKSDLTVRHGRIEKYSLFQFLAIGAGLVCFAIFVVDNVGAGPKLDVTRAELGPDGRYLAVSVDCRSGAGSGCRGEITVELASKHPLKIGRAMFSAKSDGPLQARVPLSRAAKQYLAAEKPPRLSFQALATGRFGNQTEKTQTLALSLSGRRRPLPGAGGPG